MRGYNHVSLIGNLTRDPEIRYTGSGTAVVSFDIAINEKFGEKEEVTYVRITVWGTAAENCGKYLGKGSGVMVDGRLRLNKWETDAGDKRQQLEVNANRVLFLDKKPVVEKDTSQEDDEEIPF